MIRTLLTVAAAISVGGAGAGPSRTSAGELPARDPRHVALFIGIADYQHFTPDGPPGKSDLSGPTNDVERMRKSLERWNFAGAEDVRVLTNAQASRQGIADGFRWLASRATDTSDVVVIFFSGHGTFVPDADGDEARVTPGDVDDEALIPSDAPFEHSAQHLVLDDQIRTWLAAIGTENITLIIDACYSGTVTRGGPNSQTFRAKGPERRTGGPGAVATDVLDNPRHTLITAARADQTAAEMPFPAEGRWYGVLAYHLTRALDGADAATARYDDVMQEVIAAVRGELVPQIPQLEGDRTARLFRVRGEVARRPFVTLAVHQGRTVIDAGAIHGVRPSAVYEVFAGTETRFNETALGQVRVDSIEGTRSFVTPVDSTFRPRPGSRAVLARVPLGVSTLKTVPAYFGRGLSAATRSAIDALGVTSSVRDSASATVHVLPAASGGMTRVLVNGVVLPEADPQLVAARRARGQADTLFASAEELCPALVRAFSITAMDHIRNPGAVPNLQVDFQAVPAGRRPSDAAPSDTAAIDTLFIGRQYDFYVRVRAPAGSRLYLTAALQGYTSAPFVLFPATRAMNQPIELNVWRKLWDAPLDMVEPAGVEVVRVVVNTTQYDLHPLVESLPRCSARGDQMTRGPQVGVIEPIVSGWTSVARRIFIAPAAR